LHRIVITQLDIHNKPRTGRSLGLPYIFQREGVLFPLDHEQAGAGGRVAQNFASLLHDDLLVAIVFNFSVIAGFPNARILWS
jgi:hypothetical protein